MDLVHEQDFTLARSEPADKLVFLRDVFPRAIDGAAEDLRILRIFQLMRLPKVVVVLKERVGLYLLGEQLGRRPAAPVFARSQRFCCAEDRGQREGFDAERRGQTPALAPHAL